MQTCFPGSRVTDGDRFGVVAYILQGDNRGYGGGSSTEARVEWDDGSFSWECIEDLLPETTDADR